MKLIKTLIGVALIFGVATADARPGHYRSYRNHHNHHGHAVGLVVLGGLIGAAIANANAPEPVYSPPPYAYPTPRATYYFCYSTGTYYPQTRYCPEGWRIVYQ